MDMISEQLKAGVRYMIPPVKCVVCNEWIERTSQVHMNAKSFTMEKPTFVHFHCHKEEQHEND